MNWKKRNLSHSSETNSLHSAITELRDKIIKRGDLNHVSVDEQLKFIDELEQFPFGRYILERKGANAYWTDCLMAHPKTGRISGLNVDGKPFSPLEDFIFNRSLITLASQERFSLFQKVTQERIREGATLASIPCGAMRDLLTLDFLQITDFKLIGVDLDPESLSLARDLAIQQKLSDRLQLILADAWDLPFQSELDLITSSGLNIYESDKQKVIELYRQFFKCLKAGGVLVLGFLTPPPQDHNDSIWNLREIPEKDLWLEKVLYQDILNLKWRNFRTPDEIIDELKQAGFSRIDVHFDRLRVFPTVLAFKNPA